MKTINDPSKRQEILDRRLRGVTFFNELKQNNPSDLHQFLLAAELYWAEAGEIILHQGDPATSLYFLLEGDLTVQSNEESPSALAEISSGEMLGTMAFLTNGQRSASLRVSGSHAVILSVDYSLINDDAHTPLSIDARTRLFRHLTASLRWNLEKLRMARPDEALSQSMRRIPLHLAGGKEESPDQELSFLRHQASFMANLLSEWNGHKLIAS